MKLDDTTLDTVLPLNSESTALDWHYLRKLPELLSPDVTRPVDLLDLGAGNGMSRGQAQSVLGADNLRWTGVDIGDSDEHLTRPDTAPPIDVYDGVNLPYWDAAFDVVWSKQVLEHVRHPDAVIAEVSRVLRPGGLFVGSVSQLEPYHSRSIFNWTYYGIRVVFADHRLDVIELSPGADGLLMMLRAVFGYSTGLNAFFSTETPFNQVLSALFNQKGAAPNDKTATRQKLKVAGHIHFAAQKRLTDPAGDTGAA